MMTLRICISTQRISQLTAKENLRLQHGRQLQDSFAYRRSIAKDVLGTDDPDKVQEALSTWDKFDKVAEQAALLRVTRCFQVMMIHTEYSLTMYQLLGLILITRLLLMITL